MFGHPGESVEGAPHIAGDRAQIHLNRRRKARHPRGSTALSTARKVSSSAPRRMRSRRPSPSTSSRPASSAPASSLTSAKLALRRIPAPAELPDRQPAPRRLPDPHAPHLGFLPLHRSPHRPASLESAAPTHFRPRLSTSRSMQRRLKLRKMGSPDGYHRRAASGERVRRGDRSGEVRRPRR